MTYEIYITRAAEKDLNSALDYIEYVLLNPQAADDLLENVEKEIQELSDFPEKYALIDDPVLKAWGVRYTVIKNYLAFYAVSEEEYKVFIVRFLYGKRDWTTILKQGFSLE